MSLTSTMYTGVSGLLANAEGINVIGNNLANSNTIGFKGSSTLFSDMLSSTIGNNSQIGHGVQIQKVDTNFSQGSLESTTSVTDLAIQGNGFFALAGPNSINGTAVPAANAYYTQAGSFRLDSTGLGLVNPDGYKVLDTAGKPIVFPASYAPATGASQTFQSITGVDSTGVMTLLYADSAGNSSTLYYAGDATAPTSTYASAVQIAETKVPNPAGMASQAGTLFTLTTESGTPAAPATGVFSFADGIDEKMLSHNLEESNVDMAAEFVNMITTQRAYSANSKTITTADQMTQELLSLKQ